MVQMCARNTFNCYINNAKSIYILMLIDGGGIGTRLIMDLCHILTGACTHGATEELGEGRTQLFGQSVCPCGKLKIDKTS